MKCWKCGTEQENLPEGKISFRAVCEKCGLALHSCSNCRYYRRGLPNDCMIPGTEMIQDREKQNFCEDFAPKKEADAKTESCSNAAKRLFGTDADNILPKKSAEERFKSLFDE